jgi:NAD(P)-dependent dehydrogenase (short-subunit alcohol dehydrogenase family)
MKYSNNRPLAVVTGATGGIGTATARWLGMTSDLILTDIDADRLAALAASLEADGARVLACPVGMLQDRSAVAALSNAIPQRHGVDILVHAAGLASVQGDWKQSVMANVVGTRMLIDAIEPKLADGSVTILLSSLAGHATVPVGPADAMLENWRSPTLLDDLAPLLADTPEQQRSGYCYVLAKRMILRLSESLSVEWAKRGRRIVTISPGLVDTPMGRAEAAENPAAQSLLRMVPLGQFVQPNDIAAAIGFLISPAARFITGTDLKIDGGLQAAILKAAT